MGEGFFMYNRPETVLEQYELELKELTKGRGAYICDTDKGRKVLIPFRGSKERAEYLSEMLRLLTEYGFQAEKICLTREGEASAEDDLGVRYWLKDFTEGSECSTSREEEMRGAVSELARFHTAAAAVVPEAPKIMLRVRSEPGELYGRHERELVKVKNYIYQRRSRNEPERLFLEQYPYYIEQAGRAVSGIEESLSADKATKTICHGAFHQHNILRRPEGMRIINFETALWNEPVVDLANFVRKMMEKNQWDLKLGIGIIESYDRKRTLSKKEWKLLFNILLFPEKFWKISNHYYNSHKAWISERDISKFRQVAAAETKRALFLEKMFLFLPK
jgi:CotS family spore coat protein